MTRRRGWMLPAVLIVLLGAAPSLAEDDKNTIKGRLEKRYPTLVKLMDAEKVGEMYDGLAGAVKAEYLADKVDDADADSPTIGEFLKTENADRKELFRLVAEGRDITPAQVGILFGKMAFKKAAPDHYLKPKGHDWLQKKNIAQGK